MEKEIRGKKYEIKKISYLQAVEVEEAREKEGLAAGAKKLLIFGTNLTEEEIDKLEMADGLEIQKEINSLNSLDFQNPTEEQKEN